MRKYLKTVYRRGAKIDDKLALIIITSNNTNLPANSTRAT